MNRRISVRLAGPPDAQQIAALAESTFRDAFSADNQAADIDAYVAEAFSVVQVGRELADPVNTFLVAEVTGSDGPLGYAKLRAGSPDPSVQGPNPIEMERIYADSGSLGRGVGAALTRSCLERAGARGFQTLWLGVWEHNHRAIEFYKRWGFRTVGAHVFRLGSDDQTDLIMERPVSRPD